MKEIIGVKVGQGNKIIVSLSGGWWETYLILAVMGVGWNLFEY